MDIGRLDSRVTLLVPSPDGTFNPAMTVWCQEENANNRRESNFDIANPSGKGIFRKFTIRKNSRLLDTLHTNCRFKGRGKLGELYQIENITHDETSITVSVRVMMATYLLSDFCNVYSLITTLVPGQYGMPDTKKYSYPQSATHHAIKFRMNYEIKMRSKNDPTEFENNMAQALFAEDAPIDKGDIFFFNGRYYKVENVTNNRSGYIECEVIVINKVHKAWGDD